VGYKVKGFHQPFQRFASTHFLTNAIGDSPSNIYICRTHPRLLQRCKTNRFRTDG